MSFFDELKRRNVFRVGVAYVVGSWLLIQGAETVFPLFGFDDTPARIVVIVLALALVYFAADKFVLSGSREAGIAAQARQEGRTEALVESYGEKSMRCWLLMTCHRRVTRSTFPTASPKNCSTCWPRSPNCG